MHDVIVVGLGAMGSHTLHQLARRGHRVLGLDRFAPPHGMGSSHGKSRIIREAYFEDPRYVPLVQRAYACWHALEEESGETLFARTGGLMLGPPDGVLVTGALRSAETHGLPHERWSAEEVRARLPMFRPDPDMVGVWEPRAGVLAPERAIRVALAQALRHGADVHGNEAMRAWRVVDGGVEVETDTATYRAAQLVLTVGAWTRDVVPELALPLVVQRNVVYWFDPSDPSVAFDAAHFPIFLCEHAPGRAWYGFPDMGDGLKLALHHHGVSTHPDHVLRTVSPDEVAKVRALIARYLPAANGALRDTTVCLYTNTPDEHFIIDRHPHHAQVLVASPCSGHGFKFASVVGELLADLLEQRAPAFDLSPFGLERFGSGNTTGSR